MTSVAFVCGAALALVALAGWQVPPGEPAGATVSVSSGPSGEVGVEPSGAIIAPVVMSPGSPAAAGVIRLRNDSGRTLDVGAVGRGPGESLDLLAHIELTVPGGATWRGNLGQLRAGTGRLIRLDPGEAARLEVRVGLRSGGDHAAREAEIVLAWETSLAG